MGTSKAALEWHGSTLLWRTVAIISRVTDGPAIVVRAAGQPLPALPPNVEVVDDPRESLGPVQGLAAGLRAIVGRAEVAFVSSTDLPFLHPAFVQRVLRAAEEGADVALPLARGYPQPLAAAYRATLAPVAERLVAEQRLRPAFLFEKCMVSRLDEDALRADPALAALDPDLDSLANVNEPADYETARARPAPEVTVQRFGALAGGHRGPQLVRAATIAEAAVAAGITLDGRSLDAHLLDGHVVVALNGDQISGDGQTPLATGDTLTFLPADVAG
jgi:molybdopterin-guanine dinucleotide biosynthesis protein A